MPLVISAPSSGDGGDAPSPRKLNDAVSRMASPISSDALTSSGTQALGTICRARIPSSDRPIARAATTYSFVRSTMTCARASRAYCGHQMRTIEIIAFRKLGPKMDTMAMAMIRPGNEMKTSATRMAS